MINTYYNYIWANYFLQENGSKEISSTDTVCVQS